MSELAEVQNEDVIRLTEEQGRVLLAAIAQAQAQAEARAHEAGPVYRLPYCCRVPVHILAIPFNPFGALHYIRGDMQLCVLCACTFNLMAIGIAADAFLYVFAAMRPGTSKVWAAAREMYFATACSLVPLVIHRYMRPIDQPMFAAWVLTMTGRMPWYYAPLFIMPAHVIPPALPVAAWYVQREASITLGVFGVLLVALILVVMQPDVGRGITVYYASMLLDQPGFAPSRRYALGAMAASVIACAMMARSHF